MFTDMKRCASREKDVIIEAQKKQIDSLHNESYELRRQRDQLLQRLQRAETKKVAGRVNVDIKKSRSFSSNSAANGGKGPKVSLSDYCLAEKVKVSHAAAASTRRVGRSTGLLAPACEATGSGAAATHLAVEQSSAGACPAAQRKIGSSGSACDASRQTQRSTSAPRRHQQQPDGGRSGGVRQKRAASRSPSHGPAEAITAAAQRRLAAEIIQYQYRQHALSKSFERLKSRSASSCGFETSGGRRGGSERSTAEATGGWCSPTLVSSEAADLAAPARYDGSARFAAVAATAAAAAGSVQHGQTLASVSLCSDDEANLGGNSGGTACHCCLSSAAAHDFAAAPFAAPSSAAAKMAGPFPRPADCGICRFVDGPSALCEKELEEADTSVFEVSYMSAATATAYSVPPSPYDNVSAEGDVYLRHGAAEENTGLHCCDTASHRADCTTPCSVACLAVASRGLERRQQRWARPAAAAQSLPGEGDECRIRALPHQRLATSSDTFACGCQAVPLLLLDCTEGPREQSQPTRSAAGSKAAACPVIVKDSGGHSSARQQLRERQASASSTRALSCRSAPPSSSLHSAGVLWPGGHAAAAEKERKRQYRIGLNLFNKKPEQGIEYLVERRFLERTPRSTAHFLLTRKGISKQLIGEYLGNLMQPFNQEVLRSFVNQLDFKGLELDDAMRLFTALFRLPGEAQKIERIVEVFSQRYGACNPEFALQFRSADTVFVLAFAIILLNTDLHNPNIKATRRMPLEGFINNLKGIDAGYDVDRSLLTGIYERIQLNELKPGSDHTNQVRKVEETIVEKRCAVPKLAVPFRRLVCYCRLYEVQEPSKKERIGAHQREVFLFNDILVVTKIFSKKKKTITYSFRSSYPLIDLKATTFETEHHPYGIHLAVAADSRPLIFFNARNNHDREKFVDDLRECIQEMNEMESVRLEMASCHGKSGLLTAVMPTSVTGQQQLVPMGPANRCSKDSGVVMCPAVPLQPSPQLLLPSPGLDVSSEGAAHGANSATYHNPASRLEPAADCSHRQQQQCSGSDLDNDEVGKRHSSGSIDSGMISTSTGSVAEARDDEGSPRQAPFGGGGSSRFGGGGREAAVWVQSPAAQQHVQSTGLAKPDGLSHIPHSVQN